MRVDGLYSARINRFYFKFYTPSFWFSKSVFNIRLVTAVTISVIDNSDEKFISFAIQVLGYGLGLGIMIVDYRK